MKRFLPIILLILSLSFYGFMYQGGKPVAVVVGDGEIGNSTNTVDSAGAAGAYYYYSEFTPTTPGNIRYLRYFSRDVDDTDSSDVCLVIWNDNAGDAGTVLGYCTATYTSSTDSWKHCDMGSEKSLSNGATYRLGIIELTGDTRINAGTITGHVDYDGEASPSCGSDENLTSAGTIYADKIIMHGDNNDSATP